MTKDNDIDKRLLIDFNPKPKIDFNPKPKISIIDKTHQKIIIKNTFIDGREVSRTDREVVTERRLGDRKIKFHQQLNGYDCGPCLALNVLEIFKNETGTIEDTRRQINSHSSLKSGDREWVYDSSLESFFSNKGFRIDYYNLPNNQNFQRKIGDATSFKDEIFVFSGSNHHFSGYFLDKSSQVWLVDSLKDAPILSSIDTMKSFLNNLGRNNQNARASVIQMRNNA